MNNWGGSVRLEARRIEYDDPAKVILRGRCVPDNDCGSIDPWSKRLDTQILYAAIAAKAAMSSFPRKATCRHSREGHNIVIPAKAGIQRLLNERHWVPAFAGTTQIGNRRHLAMRKRCGRGHPFGRCQ